MKQFSYVLTKPHALRAKPISKLQREAARFVSQVRLSLEDQLVNLKEARLLKKAGCGSRIVITIEGRDEEAAVAAIQNYVVANM